MSNVGRGGANTVEFDIDRWSTDAERDALIAAFNEKGPDGLLSALQKTKRVGFMRLPNTLMDVRINAQGEGEGKMSVATKITYNKKKNTVELENYASEPVRLQNVRAEAKK